MQEKTEKFYMLGKTDGTKVELIYDKKQSEPLKCEGLSIGFEVKSLDEAMELFKAHSIHN